MTRLNKSEQSSLLKQRAREIFALDRHFATPRAAVLHAATRLREGAPQQRTRGRARVVRLQRAPCAAARAPRESARGC
jgi:hypothetical protein